MLTTKNIRSNNDARVSEEKQDQKQNQNHTLAQQLPQGLLPLDDEQITRLLDLVAVENHKILRLSLLESF